MTVPFPTPAETAALFAKHGVTPKPGSFLDIAEDGTVTACAIGIVLIDRAGGIERPLPPHFLDIAAGIDDIFDSYTRLGAEDGFDATGRDLKLFLWDDVPDSATNYERGLAWGQEVRRLTLDVAVTA